MTQLRIAEAASLLGVSDDTLRRRIDRGRLTATTDEGGRKVVAGADVAELARRLAQDEPGDRRALSARNRFLGLVTKVTSDVVMSQVELQCGRFRVVSLISTEAVRELGLEVGSLAVAQVKATNVVIEAP